MEIRKEKIVTWQIVVGKLETTTMIIDLRKQKRIIKIELEKVGYDYDLDRLVDRLVEDVKIICEQRELPKGTKIEIILE